MKYKIEITEKMKSVIEVNARSVADAIAKAEKKYYNDNVELCLSNVEFVAIINENNFAKKEIK